MTEPLGTLLAKLVEAKKDSEIDLDLFPMRTRAAHALRKREGEDSIVALKGKYTKRLFSNSIAFFPMGTKEQETKFAEIAETVGKTTTVDAHELYKTIAQTVSINMAGSEFFGPDQMAALITAIRPIAVDMGVMSMKSPEFEETVALKNADQVAEYVRKLVTKAVGDELNRLYLEQKLVAMSIKSGFDGNTFPVVLVNATPSEVQGLSGLFSVVAPVELEKGAEVTEQGVVSTFKKYSKKNRG